MKHCWERIFLLFLGVLTIVIHACFVNLQKSDLLLQDGTETEDGSEAETVDVREDRRNDPDLVEHTEFDYEAINGFQYVKPIIISNAGGELTDYDVLVELDTALLIEEGRMQGDCDDMRFLDTDMTTFLAYWLEQGCGSPATQLWVRIPFIPSSSTKMIFMIHGKDDAASGGEPFAGSFIFMLQGSCPFGWTHYAGLDDRFPRGATPESGIQEGGSYSHSHTFECDTEAPTNVTFQGLRAEETSSSSSHTHYFWGSVEDSHIPPYRTVNYCYAVTPVSLFPASLVLFYTSLPVGWNLKADLLDKFPMGSEIWGLEGGAETHQHVIDLDTGPPSASMQRGSGVGIPSYEHVHHVHLIVTGTNIPPHVDLIPASADAEATFAAGAVLPVDALEIPPLGWEVFGDLDQRFPRGSAAFAIPEPVAEEHTHTLLGMTGDASDTDGQLGGSEQPINSAGAHQHEVFCNTSPASHLPPYRQLLFVKRKRCDVDVTVVD